MILRVRSVLVVDGSAGSQRGDKLNGILGLGDM
jgi:hypothetical protein